MVAGLLDLAALTYSFVQGLAYVSGLNLFGVVVGVFLMRGSLQAALVVRWLAVWLLAALLATVFVSPFLQPFSLTFAQLRLGMGPEPVAVGLAVLALALLGWLAWQLGREPVRAARSARNLRPWSMATPALVGVALVVGVGVVVAVLRSGEAAANARMLAAQRVTPDYKLHVRSVSKSRGANGSLITANVTAWTDSDIKNLPVQWQEP
ncbi:hypothetical protein C6571_16940 [Simplicispira suum]|uniref:Uncharacterized protein n=1 Tax=Simplicispira suum TaxID=2109915 RepID=A0A2S0N3R7_9BURK|nr:hypothetical protein C6571_16940 [Simplicispira suum]